MAEPKPKARRCSVCDTDWPMEDAYEKCPRGHGPTWIAQDQIPVGLEKAEAIRRSYLEFEAYLAAESLPKAKKGLLRR